ncbi:hypothetical protein [Enterovibrio coralii]|uniref:Uncharacterized protein n=1 Tax=Enterovibrio coralii TaxID=294935 RepID=A0A135I4H2_9GAMM|nr:hypothetical protein [Enterovibrio coralii]KXF80325.1 hypothetical protein ATN88_10915 [Enterovibrio coralii]
MDIKYSEMLGETYEELMKDSTFLSAIGGNVPEQVTTDAKNFHILSPSKNISFTFDKASHTLKFASLSPDSNGLFMYGLTTMVNREQAAEMLGHPIDGEPAQKIPLLGMVGAWSTFIVEGNKLMLMFSADTGCLEKIRFTL